MQPAFDYFFKVVIVGDSGVGKTSLLNRLLKDTFDEDINATIGVEVAVHTVDIDGKIVKVQYWDTSGKEKFEGVTKYCSRLADGFFIVFDATNDKSLENVTKWSELISLNGSDNVITKMIISNKCEPPETNWQSTLELARQTSEKLEADLFAASARTGDDISVPFVAMARQLKKQSDLNSLLSSDNHETEDLPPAPGGMCFSCSLM